MHATVLAGSRAMNMRHATVTSWCRALHLCVDGNISERANTLLLHMAVQYTEDNITPHYGSRSVVLISRLKNTIDWFAVREKILFRLKKQAEKYGL
jgi:hypothetical protein